MIPDQTTKPYLRGIEQSDSAASSLAAALRDSFQRFWGDPVAQAPILEREAAACGMTALEVFQQHAAALQYLAVAKPQKLTWFSGVPFEAPFLESGGFDHAELAVRYAAWLAAQPQPEPEEEEEPEP